MKDTTRKEIEKHGPVADEAHVEAWLDTFPTKAAARAAVRALVDAEERSGKRFSNPILNRLIGEGIDKCLADYEGHDLDVEVA